MSQPSVVLITGATGAIGSALAASYATRGRTLVLQGRNAARLDEVARACEARGAIVEKQCLDVRDISALAAWIDRAASRHPVDLAIFNAGVINVLRPGETVEDAGAVERVTAVNVHATRTGVEALLPHMRRRGSGQIALMSSLAAWFELPVAPAYSASKAELKNYGESLREALSRDGIRVSVVMPGFVKSAMSDELRVAKPFMMSAEEAARRIRRGLEQDRARISFPFPLYMGIRLLSVLPLTMQRLVLSVLGFNRR